MAFLTKSEKVLINLINTNGSLLSEERSQLVHKVKHNARLRQDGNRGPVRVFLNVITNYQAAKMANTLK